MTSDRSIDLQKSQFIRDCAEKEERAQIRFYLQNKTAGKLVSGNSHSKQYETFKKRIISKNEGGTAQQIAKLGLFLQHKKIDHRMKKPHTLLKNDLFRQPDDSVNWKFMRPVTPEIKKFIYNGVSHELQGR